MRFVSVWSWVRSPSGAYVRIAACNAGKHDPPRTRTWNIWLRRPTPYPLGQRGDAPHLDAIAEWRWSHPTPRVALCLHCLMDRAPQSNLGISRSGDVITSSGGDAGSIPAAGTVARIAGLAPQVLPSSPPVAARGPRTCLTKHQLSSGRIHRCHRCDPGSIPG